MKQRLFIQNIAIAATLALSAGIISCSSGPSTVAEKPMQMPTEYPKSAAQSLSRLNDFVPQNSEVLAFASYGSLTDAILQFKKWNVVDSKEIDNLLTDLGTHYLLNPSSLKSYFDAGFHTGSGFTAGLLGQSVFIVFDVINHNAFRHWWDNFMNEEFGRPRYSEEKVGAKTLLHIDILKRDFATLVFDGTNPVTVVFGEGIIKDSPSSMNAAKSIIESKKLSDESVKKIAKSLNDSPFGMWVKTTEKSFKNLPSKVQSLKDWCTSAGLELNFGEKGPELRLSGLWNDTQYNDVPRGHYISTIFKGSNGGWADKIMATAPTSAFRILTDSEVIESLALPYANEKQRSQYADLKDKLTQRLIKLNVTEQIIYNIGAVWAVIYDAQAPALREPTITEILSAQKAALFIPFKDASQSDSFFAKLNVLKKLIPEDKAIVEMDENGVLHASVTQSGKVIHIGYANGLIAVATESSWKTAFSVFNKTGNAAPKTSLSEDNHALAAQIRVSDMTTILGLKYAIVKEQIGNFLSPFDRFEMQLSTGDDKFSFAGKGILK